MRHRKVGRKFHRKTGPRRAFLRLLACNVIRRERVVTTEMRAKELRPLLERAVTTAKKGTLASRRLLISRFHDLRVVEKLCGDLAERLKERPGGYTRITKLGISRKRDGTR